MKNYDKARQYLNILVAPGSETVPTFIKRDAHLLLYRADSASANYSSAIAHLKDYKSLNDSIFNEKRNSQIEALRLQYESEKKDKDIQLLSKHAELQAADLRQAKLMRNIFIGGLIVLLVILGMGYSRYRLKQRSNQLLQEKQKEINQTNSDLRHLNEEQQKLIKEKEWLVREIHHRVKNNLQTIISLLNAQSEFLEHPVAISAIEASRERMHAIATLHQKLYQSEQGRTVNMESYIREIANHFRDGQTVSGLITFSFDVGSIELDLSQAVPLCLILNEAITNSMKHAFGKSGGEIHISFYKTETKAVVLTVRDNGKGIPGDFSYESSNSLGIHLMQLFAEQLEGELGVEGGEGTAVRVSFVPFTPGKLMMAREQNEAIYG
ncbi:MAG: sensor histidine kinase [Chitinophagaceae bacterium]